MANNRLAYGLAKEAGIDTTGMTPEEVWAVLKEQGIAPDTRSAHTSYDKITAEDEPAVSDTVHKSAKIKLLHDMPSDTFADSIKRAKDLNNNNGWAVDAKSVEEYNNMHRILSENGGAGIAVEESGNIVSVFNAPDSGIKGASKTLLEEAVKAGGDRLDAFGKGLFNIYTRNGFEPVSWTEWSDEESPPDWDESKGRHPVIFYRYTGKKAEGRPSDAYENFLKTTESSKDYDTAKAVRDKTIGGKKK